MGEREPGTGPRSTTREVHAIREAGLLTAADVARALGIGKTTLYRLEGKLFEPVPRQGKRQMRVFTPDQVAVLRKALRVNARSRSLSGSTRWRIWQGAPGRPF